MKNKVLFTVDGYELKWSNISANEAKSILSEVLGKDDFDFYHFDITKALWRTGKFYVANVDSAVYSLLNGKEKVSQLSFQVTETDPL